jgi:hypothetical protein
MVRLLWDFPPHPVGDVVYQAGLVGHWITERERLRRADAARRAYFTRLAYLSARTRRGAGQ